MNKRYITPAIEVLRLETESILAESVLSSNVDVDYGGTDLLGQEDPDAPLIEALLFGEK
ncbi:MAG: hypothetical protein IJ637_02975 [Prevotella sp.]|nr:hypothetical protein [Prevotella sp.]